MGGCREGALGGRVVWGGRTLRVGVFWEGFAEPAVSTDSGLEN